MNIKFTQFLGVHGWLLVLNLSQIHFFHSHVVLNPLSPGQKFSPFTLGSFFWVTLPCYFTKATHIQLIAVVGFKAIEGQIKTLLKQRCFICFLIKLDGVGPVDNIPSSN